MDSKIFPVPITTSSFKVPGKPSLPPAATVVPPARLPPSSPPAVQSPSTVPRHPKFPERAAFPESLPLHSKNPKSIYRDIQRLARRGKLRQTLTILDYLEHRGIPVSPTTFSALLSAASQAKSLSSARQIHVHLRINGLDRNEFLLTKLVETYAVCGSTADAWGVFAELSPSSVYPWNALLRGSISGGRRWGHEPLSVFLSMREAGVEVNEHTFSSLLKSFAGSPALTQGMKTHALLIKNGFAGAPWLIKTGLIDVYFKCGRTRMAIKVFDEMPEKDIVVWGTVIAGFAHNKLHREALNSFRHMGDNRIEPNSVVLTSLLPVVAELLQRNLGREIHCYVMKRFRNYTKMVSIQTGLIDMYCRCKDMVSARGVFYSISERNEVCWTALMSGYASNNRHEQALRTIVWMQQEGIKPDIVSIATVLPISAKLKAWRHGQEIHAYALKHLFLPNVPISTSLITMYSECGKQVSCCKVFDEMPRKNLIAWTALLESYLRAGWPVESLQVFRTMLRANQRPDALILCRILKATGDLSALKLGKEIHAQVFKLKLDMYFLLVAGIVNFYGKCREIQKARKVFDGAQSRGSLTWTAVIEACCYNKEYKEALDLFNEMLSAGYSPNNFTFSAVFSMCDQAGLADEALRLFDAMIRQHNVNATKGHCDCMIGLLMRSGRMDEAQRFAMLRSTLV
ncbi:Pentatricopeptide repeat-containing protein [Apostasia shenzhenica]|uniref:Pentatricopeptide repeat-containing protein n=1 Tax=Apostasia shenzhenica TaxID=1088818 RepID=A0A2I0ANN5_9ASPA|nr:Pentatricopeptide repeat-containing protein [Apostasia shenzhenica]